MSDSTVGEIVVRADGSSARSAHLSYTISWHERIIEITSRTSGGSDLIAPDALIALARTLLERQTITIFDRDTEHGLVPCGWQLRLLFAGLRLPLRLLQPILGGIAVEISPPDRSHPQLSDCPGLYRGDR